MSSLLFWLGASYLLGSVPTSWLVVRLVKGLDLRTLGSGNLGATNLFRQLGWRYAIPVGLFDMAKGAIPVLVFGPLARGGDLTPLMLGLAAVCGHVYSVFVRFKGGKGVATGAGVVLGLAPWAFLVALAVWVVTVRLTGLVSLGSLLAAAALPPAVWLLQPDRRSLTWLFALLALLIIGLHHANIRRLLQGTEPRFGQRGPRADRGTA